jgi:tRNA (guanine9-N1)-methyltransferase
MRRSTHPPAGGIVLTSYGGRLQTMMQQRHPAADRWQNVRLEKDGYEHLFDKSTLVYLSADAEQELATLEPGKVYVIGCLVDKNRYKGLTHNKATELGITTARLPIGSFVKMVQRKVLAVNHGK